ncbi:MAG: GlsB/YeaQ/YmgE family stress response membrane protein [Pirellulales bacterium]|nr:GlsB/YeaQ/YmgE family stress response membrane protein [Pirellulales bacterium]
MLLAGKIVVWLLVGAFAGTLAGRLVTLSKEGYGHWTNFAIGIVGALVGGLIFWLFSIDLGLGELKVTFEDLLSAFVGSLVCVFAWWIYEKNASKTPTAPADSKLKL